MDRSSGSVKRARERIQASGRVPGPRRAHHNIAGEDDSAGNLNPAPRHHLLPSNPPPPPPPDPQSPRSPQQRGAGGSESTARGAIPRPSQSPQWPLSPNSPLAAEISPTAHRIQNPASGRQKPRRSPPSSETPDYQEQIPVFLKLQDGEEDQKGSADDSQPPSSANPSGRHKSPSAGSIPQFPEPSTSSTVPPVPPKRSLNLGPPPSSRRGASSYYSHNSFVSPIPEENPRSAGSYASSAAIPRHDSWGSISPLSSPIEGDGNGFYEASVKSRDSGLDELSDESKLVRSASIGKKGKASLVDNKRTPSVRSASVGSILIARPSPTPVQMPFGEGTGYVDTSTSSSDNTLHLKKVLASNPEVHKAAGKVGPPESRSDAPTGHMPSPRMAIPGQPAASGRVPGMRRPPRLDIDAVRDMEARGSLTSLPDLIQRATRLAAMIDKGKRPASRFDLHDYSVSDGPSGSGNGRVQSGLSDMLAAFPPPAQPTPTGGQSRGSWFRHTAWPRVETQGRTHDANDQTGKGEHSEKVPPRTAARRCCGMPPWLFVLVVVLLIAVVAVAIIIPLEFFVFKNLGNHQTPESSLDKCRSELPCQNGGTNVFNDNVCSCLCTNGYTGHNCSTVGSEGCTTTNLVSSSSSSTIENVTLGLAIPRLILDSNTNFSIPLSGTSILAKINSGDLSCRTQNALVTFQGRSTRTGDDSVSITNISADTNSNERREESETATATVTTTARAGNSLVVTASIPIPTKTASIQPTLKSDLFNLTEETLDFARVAVLYVLQEQNATTAVNAQSYLQRFFTRASSTEISVSYATQSEARKVDIGANSTINLVDFRLNLGKGSVGN
ncbi:unnamed protein product [Clonostachys rosea f. rosea IK726]|uniref:EGF-like domain-containing protein n=3 Tax=Bionectria ochroleuca TaxID=29856 RepID=A0A0B7KF58_BIOOC|nr:unnamed protein product [Clonostachys rosea f. rosea IK726]